MSEDRSRKKQSPQEKLSETWGLKPCQFKLALCVVITSLEDRQVEPGDSWMDTLLCSEASARAIPKSRPEVKCKDLHIY